MNFPGHLLVKSFFLLLPSARNWSSGTKWLRTRHPMRQWFIHPHSAQCARWSIIINWRFLLSFLSLLGPGSQTGGGHGSGGGSGGSGNSGGSGALFSPRQQAKKKRKSRTAFTNHQIFELEKRFLYQKYLSPADRDEVKKKVPKFWSIDFFLKHFFSVYSTDCADVGSHKCSGDYVVPESKS